MALPTLSLQLKEGRTFDVVSSDPMSGYFSRRATNGVAQRTFEIVWPLLSSSDVTDLETEFDNAMGGAGQVTLTHPSEGALTCRFENDRLRVQRVSVTKYTAAATLAVEPAGTA